jgi:hypothetical protein
MLKSKLLWMIFVAAILVACVLYLYRASRNQLNIDPHAAEEIKKAGRR